MTGPVARTSTSMDSPARIEPEPTAATQEPSEPVLTWNDLARYAKTGCRRCHSAGYIQVREYQGKADAKGQRILGAPTRQRCACTDRGLDRAGLVLVETPHGVVARKATP